MDGGILTAVLLVFFGALSAFIWGGRNQSRRNDNARRRAEDQTNRRIDDARPPRNLDDASVADRLRRLVGRNRR